MKRTFEQNTALILAMVWTLLFGLFVGVALTKGH